MCEEWLQGLGKIEGLTFRDAGRRETASGSSEAQQPTPYPAPAEQTLQTIEPNSLAPPLFLQDPHEQALLPTATHLQKLCFSEEATNALRGIALEVEHTLTGGPPCRCGDPEQLPPKKDLRLFPNMHRFLDLCRREVCIQEQEHRPELTTPRRSLMYLNYI